MSLPTKQVAAIRLSIGVMFYSILMQSTSMANEVDTDKVQEEQVLQQSVPASILSLKDALVSAEIAANVGVIYTEVGDKVVLGDKLAELDCREYDAKLDKAKADVETVRAQLLSAKSLIQSRKSDIASSKANEELLEAEATAQRSGIALAKAKYLAAKSRVKADTAKCHLANIELQRSRNLRKQRLISQQELDKALTEYQAAQAECDAVQSALIGVQSDIATTQAKTDAAMARVKARQSLTLAAESNLDAARTDIKAIEAKLTASLASLETEKIMVSRCTLVAPFDGQIVHREVQQGQRIGPGEKAFQLISVSDIEVSAALSSHELTSLKTANDIYFQAGKARYKLSLRSVVGIVTGQARTQEVRLKFIEKSELPVGLNGRITW